VALTCGSSSVVVICNKLSRDKGIVMGKTKYSIFILLVTIFFQQCTHYYYAPNTVNVPLFQEKGGTKISIITGGSDDIGLDEVQFAHSVTDHIGFMVNRTKAFDAYENDWGRGYYLEGAIGYFTPLSRRTVFEIYGGYGDCDTKHQYQSTQIAHTEFDKYFIQPSIGFRSKYFDIALSTRFCTLYFDHLKYREDLILDERKHLDYIRNNRFSYLLEPAITINFGLPNYKLTFQVVNSHNLSHSRIRQGEENISFGIHFISPACKK